MFSLWFLWADSGSDRAGVGVYIIGFFLVVCFSIPVSAFLFPFYLYIRDISPTGSFLSFSSSLEMLFLPYPYFLPEMIFDSFFVVWGVLFLLFFRAFLVIWGPLILPALDTPYVNFAISRMFLVRYGLQGR